MRNLRAVLFVGTLAVGLLARPAWAQAPSPSPSPAPSPVAFSARGHADVTVTVQGNTFAGNAQLGLAQRGNRTRIDLLSLRSDAFPLPPLSLSAVIDRDANTLAVWNDVSKRYHVQALPRVVPGAVPRPSAAPSASPGPSRRTGSPLAGLDVLALSLQLTGHGVTAGLPTTGLALDLQVRRHGDTAPTHVTATTQVADAYAFFPVTLDVAVAPGSTPFGVKLAYAVDQFTRSAPAPARFEIPAGYAEARSFQDVVLPPRPAPSPSP